MLEVLAADRVVAGCASWRRALWRLLVLDPFWCVFLYRLAHALERRHVPTAPHILKGLGVALWGADISPTARIGPGLRLVHTVGIVVGPVQAGRQLTLLQNVTLGGNGDPPQCPVLGDGVTVFSGAVVIGGVTIGDAARIGANVVVRHDVPSGATIKN